MERSGQSYTCTVAEEINLLYSRLGLEMHVHRAKTQGESETLRYTVKVKRECGNILMRCPLYLQDKCE
jgi:hypothetical protein